MASKLKEPLIPTAAGGHGSSVAVDMQPDLDFIVRGTDHERGMTNDQVTASRERHGYNELTDNKKNPLLEFLSFFWGPMPIMIWIAIIVEILEVFVSDEPEKWADVSVLFILQAVNGGVGWHEHHKAADAIAALKESLAPKCQVKRMGAWQNCEARLLVPGDLIQLKFGGAVPADTVVIGKRSIHCNEAALNGEPVPKEIKSGSVALMGSAVVTGESEGIIVKTGSNTFFGSAATLIAGVDEPGNFQKVLFAITQFLMIIALICVSIILTVLLIKGTDFFEALGVCIVLLVASIPIAMQVVCTTTMAIGSRKLSEKQAIVTRLSAIEELAGMTFLCSDKTGTLTLGKMVMQPAEIFNDSATAQSILLHSCLAAKWLDPPGDAIDTLIIAAAHTAAHAEVWKMLSGYEYDDYIPFDPSTKRTEGIVKNKATGKLESYTKGAPQVILDMCKPTRGLRVKVEARITELAQNGVRALGIAKKNETGWELQGILTFQDPARSDSKETIASAKTLGVQVQMITGDQELIAKDMCRQLGLGNMVQGTQNIPDKDADMNDPKMVAFTKMVENVNGFAEVYPEHKYKIVQTLRELGHRVGMTGDGVNDGPALKRADVGIAVEGATDVAVAAADIVLAAEGLSVIIEAIERSRKIFQRMKNYVTYRVACTIQLLLFFFIAVLACDPSSSNITISNKDNDDVSYFVLPVISLVIITILNDGTIITIAYDEVHPDPKPCKWRLVRLNIVSTVLGLTACISTLVLLFVGVSQDKDSFLHTTFGLPDIDYEKLQCLIYLKISLSDFMTVFSARTTGWFWERRPGFALMVAFIAATGISTLLATNWHFGDMKSLPWGYALFCWIYCFICFLIQDVCKVLTFFIIDNNPFITTALDPSENIVFKTLSSAGPSMAVMHSSHLIDDIALSGSRKALATIGRRRSKSSSFAGIVPSR